MDLEPLSQKIVNIRAIFMMILSMVRDKKKDQTTIFLDNMSMVKKEKDWKRITE